jgi:hypothetical protein
MSTLDEIRAIDLLGRAVGSQGVSQSRQYAMADVRIDLAAPLLSLRRHA